MMGPGNFQTFDLRQEWGRDGGAADWQNQENSAGEQRREEELSDSRKKKAGERLLYAVTTLLPLVPPDKRTELVQGLKMTYEGLNDVEARQLTDVLMETYGGSGGRSADGNEGSSGQNPVAPFLEVDPRYLEEGKASEGENEQAAVDLPGDVLDSAYWGMGGEQPAAFGSSAGGEEIPFDDGGESGEKSNEPVTTQTTEGSGGGDSEGLLWFPLDDSRAKREETEQPVVVRATEATEATGDGANNGASGESERSDGGKSEDDEHYIWEGEGGDESEAGGEGEEQPVVQSAAAEGGDTNNDGASGEGGKSDKDSDNGGSAEVLNPFETEEFREARLEEMRERILDFREGEILNVLGLSFRDVQYASAEDLYKYEFRYKWDTWISDDNFIRYMGYAHNMPKWAVYSLDINRLAEYADEYASAVKAGGDEGNEEDDEEKEEGDEDEGEGENDDDEDDKVDWSDEESGEGEYDYDDDEGEEEGDEDEGEGAEARELYDSLLGDEYDEESGDDAALAVAILRSSIPRRKEAKAYAKRMMKYDKRGNGFTMDLLIGGLSGIWDEGVLEQTVFAGHRNFAMAAMKERDALLLKMETGEELTGKDWKRLGQLNRRVGKATWAGCAGDITRYIAAKCDELREIRQSGLLKERKGIKTNIYEVNIDERGKYVVRDAGGNSVDRNSEEAKRAIGMREAIYAFADKMKQVHDDEELSPAQKRAEARKVMNEFYAKMDSIDDQSDGTVRSLYKRTAITAYHRAINAESLDSVMKGFRVVDREVTRELKAERKGVLGRLVDWFRSDGAHASTEAAAAAAATATGDRAGRSEGGANGAERGEGGASGGEREGWGGRIERPLKMYPGDDHREAFNLSVDAKVAEKLRTSPRPSAEREKQIRAAAKWLIEDAPGDSIRRAFDGNCPTEYLNRDAAMNIDILVRAGIIERSERKKKKKRVKLRGRQSGSGESGEGGA